MGLEAVLIPVHELTETQVREMLHLMQSYYLNVTAGQFVRDMKEKDVVIVLHENGVIQGFSTWVHFCHDLEGEQVNVIFSGDTIIKPSHWNSLILPLAWGRLMLSVLAEHPQELYWLLTSKGYKTYRFLPVFFREFYPSCIKETPPFEKALLLSLAQRRFGQRFDPESGILRASKGAQCLRPGIADITEARRRDKHIAFFEKANPGHVNGDELVCIARCHENNLNPFILRQLRIQE
jgi:hypothetical protein